MRLKTKPEQREYVPRRARELAQTGQFSGWYEIEVHLRREESCHEARHILDNERMRENLDRLCSEAKAAHHAPDP